MVEGLHLSVLHVMVCVCTFYIKIIHTPKLFINFFGALTCLSSAPEQCARISDKVFSMDTGSLILSQQLAALCRDNRR